MAVKLIVREALAMSALCVYLFLLQIHSRSTRECKPGNFASATSSVWAPNRNCAGLAVVTEVGGGLGSLDGQCKKLSTVACFRSSCTTMDLIFSNIVKPVGLALDNVHLEILKSRGSSESIPTVGTIVGARTANDISIQGW